MRIVLDTNAFVADFGARGASFRVLRQAIHLGHRVFVPQLVIDETLRAYDAILQSMADKVRSAERELGRLLAGPLPAGYDDAWVTAGSAAYGTYLQDWLAAHHVTVLPFPAADHSSVSTRAIDRKKPFSDKGTGYRDYLIWLSVLGLAPADAEPLIFVTSNTKDFAADGKLHPDLVDDMNALGLAPESIVMASGLEVLVREHIQPLLPSLDEIQDQLNAGRYPPLDLKARLPDLIQESVQGKEWEPRDLDLPDEAETVTIESIDEPLVIEVGSVSELSDSEILISVDIEAGADLDFFVFKGDIYDPERENYHISEFNWNKHYAWAGAARPLWITLSLTFDRASASVTAIDVEDVNAGPIG